MALYLTNLELECEFISTLSKKSQLEKVCEEIYLQLTQGKECHISIDTWNVLHFEIPDLKEFAIKDISPLDVPIPKIQPEDILLRYPEITLYKIQTFLNGVNTIKKIAHETRTSVKSVIKCIRQLEYLDFITLVPVFQFSNTYRITEHIGKVLNEYSEECVEFVSLNDNVDECNIFDIYCSLSNSVLETVLKTNPNIVNQVDPVKLVQFGLVKGLIEKI